MRWLGPVLVELCRAPTEAATSRKPQPRFPRSGFSGLPLLTELPGTGWLAIAEANLTNYAGMYLARDASGGAVCWPRGYRHVRASQRSPSGRICRSRRASPHIFMIAEKVERLVESDLVLNLNAPCSLADTSWIRPGKTTFPWWNSFSRRKSLRDGAEHGDGQVLHIDFCTRPGSRITRSMARGIPPGTAARSFLIRGRHH